MRKFQTFGGDYMDGYYKLIRRVYSENLIQPTEYLPCDEVFMLCSVLSKRVGVIPNYWIGPGYS